MAGGCPQSCVWWLDIRNSGGFVDGLSCRSVSTDALLLMTYLFVGTREFNRQVHLPRKPGNPIGFSFKLGTAPESSQESLKFSMQRLSKFCFRKRCLAVELATGLGTPLNQGMQLRKRPANYLRTGFITIIRGGKRQLHRFHDIAAGKPPHIPNGYLFRNDWNPVAVPLHGPFHGQPKVNEHRPIVNRPFAVIRVPPLIENVQEVSLTFRLNQ